MGCTTSTGTSTSRVDSHAHKLDISEACDRHPQVGFNENPIKWMFWGGGKRCIKKASIIFVWSLKLANMFRRIEFHLCFPHPLYRVTDLCAQESMECSFDTYAWSHVPRGLPGPPERKMHETWWMWKSWLNDFVLSIQRMEWWKHVTCFFTKYP